MQYLIGWMALLVGCLLVVFFFFFQGCSYLCLFLIPEQLGERTYNPAVIWLVFLESIFKL